MTKQRSTMQMEQEMKFEYFVSRYGAVVLYSPTLSSGTQRYIETTSWWLVPTRDCPWDRPDATIKQ